MLPAVLQLHLMRREMHLVHLHQLRLRLRVRVRLHLRVLRLHLLSMRLLSMHIGGAQVRILRLLRGLILSGLALRLMLRLVVLGHHHRRRRRPRSCRLLLLLLPLLLPRRRWRRPRRGRLDFPVRHDDLTCRRQCDGHRGQTVGICGR